MRHEEKAEAKEDKDSDDEKEARSPSKMELREGP